MDALSIILRVVRETIEGSGAPPDALQDSIEAAERRLRSSLGGALHHISRAPASSAKARIVELVEQDPALTPAQIRERLGVSDRYVRKIFEQLRKSA